MSQFARPEKRYIESAESRHNVARSAPVPWSECTGGSSVIGEETDYSFERVWRQQLIACAVVAVMIFSGLSVFVVLASGPAAAAGPFRSLRIGINPLVITTLNPLKITLADEYVSGV